VIAAAAPSPGLTGLEVMKVVNDYIGDARGAGYLGDFSYRTHDEFYSRYCDLDVDVGAFEGTTKDRFVAILRSRSPQEQAAILRGLLECCPVDDPRAPAKRERTGAEMLVWIQRLESGAPVAGLVPETTRGVVVRALADAEQLLKTSGATSGVDRIHTALHGHLLALCDAAGIETAQDASLAAIFKALRREHPKLSDHGPRHQDIGKILNSMGAIFDAFDPVRNQASVAHPNLHLVDEAEAMLVINMGRTLLNYLDAKLR